MSRVAGFIVILLFSCFAFPLSPDAQEFIRIAKELEGVHCEKRKLRREITMAVVERRDDDAAKLRARFAELNRDPKTARLEKRLALLEPRVSKSGDPEDLAAISHRHREAFYRCE